MGRILCAWSPNWAIENWRRRTPCASPAEGTPFALVASARGVRVLSAVDAAARAAGLFVGQKATDAAALCPGLATAEAEPDADARALEALADWCVRYSPAVAPDPPDGLFLDVTGVAHLWGGEEPMMADLADRLARNGLGVRLAVADTAGAAWALARHGRSGRLRIPPGEQGRALAGLPTAALRVDPAAAEQIARLGLRRIGQLADLPRAPLARRFGQPVLDRLDQALGRAPEALSFRRPPNPWFARLAFAEPISAPEDMARVTRDVADRLCARLEREGQGARRFRLAFHGVDGRARPLSVGLALAGRDPVRLARLFAPKLETVDPGFGIEVVTLAAEEVEPAGGRQARLDSLLDIAAEDGLAPLVDRLANRLGEDRIWRAVAAESHIPEQSAIASPPLDAGAGGAVRGWDPEQPRPLRLLRRPEALDGVMALTPDDPPRQFQWRRRVHRILRAEGPERIGPEWWRAPIEMVDSAQVRDYYRVEDQDGARFWVFRDGLYADGRQPRWWLHGLFG